MLATANLADDLRLPATFTGDAPCAGCEAIHWHLSLLEDHGYELSRTWVGADLRRDEVGKWREDLAGRAIVLYGAAEMPLRLEILDPGRLRVIDTTGGVAASGPPGFLTSDGTLHPVDLTLFLGGEMVYFADAARFLECMTGRSYPIAMEGDYLALERAYVAAASPPGSPMYVTFEGALADRPKMEGEGTERAVVVKRFVNAWPGQRCERAAADASLTNTYWRVVRLQGAPVSVEAGEREPHLVLHDVDGRREYVAVTGCRRQVGPYSIDGEQIAFGPATAASSTCPSSPAAREPSLTDTLAAVARWRVHAQTLELYDASGAPVALFEAVYLR